MSALSLATALAAGVVSFLSPCILPLVPGFLSYLAGASSQAPQGKRTSTFLASVFFVIGFSVVFALLGVALNTVLEAVAYDVKLWVSRVGGTLIILFGIYLLGWLRIPFLERELKFRVSGVFASPHLTSLLFGAAFAAGWTPCAGAVLGGILGLAASEPGSAFVLLVAYSVGLGIPFLIVGAFAARAAATIRRLGPKLALIHKAFGVFLILLGSLIVAQKLNQFANLQALADLLR